MPLLLHIVHDCAPERLAPMAQSLAEAVAEPGSPPRLLVATLAGEVALLGRHQRRASAVRTAACARRLGGGRAVAAGTGTLALLLAVHDFGVPPERVLNRTVRGLNRGLTRCLKVPVSYFGRDHVVAGGGQLAVIAQETHLFEAVIAGARPLGLPGAADGYPTHSDPRIAAPRWATLGDADPARVIQSLADAYAEVLGLPVETAPPPDGGEPLPVDEDETGWRSSGVAEVPIGFVEALVRQVGNRIAAARLRGDFIAPAALVRAIEARVAGCPAVLGELAARVGDAFRSTPGAFIHGVVNIGVFAEALLEAVALES